MDTSYKGLIRNETSDSRPIGNISWVTKLGYKAALPDDWDGTKLVPNPSDMVHQLS